MLLARGHSCIALRQTSKAKLMNPIKKRTGNQWISYLKSFKQSFKKENVLGLVLISAGVLGLYLIPKSPFPSQTQANDVPGIFHAEEINLPVATIHQADEYPVQQEKKINKPTRRVRLYGTSEAGQPLFFNINNFDKRLEYRLKIDGAPGVPVRKKKFEYTFSQAGTYDVQLEVSYRGETAVIHSEKVRIKDDWFAVK